MTCCSTCLLVRLARGCCSAGSPVLLSPEGSGRRRCSSSSVPALPPGCQICLKAEATHRHAKRPSSSIATLTIVRLRGAAALAVVAFALGIDADDSVTPSTAEAAHPCSNPEFDMRLRGVAVVGSIATFRYRGEWPRRVYWGDGAISGPRRIARGRLRHRFLRPGNLTVTVVQRGFECCSIDHSSCSPPRKVRHTLAVHVRRT